MQLMETEFSKTLGDMVALHLHHQKSIPAFLSAKNIVRPAGKRHPLYRESQLETKDTYMMEREDLSLLSFISHPSSFSSSSPLTSYH
ncbi:hypothetical protein PAMP_021368 [Pampus punctatissimus]